MDTCPAEMGSEMTFAVIYLLSNWSQVILSKVDCTGEAQKDVLLIFSKGVILCVLRCIGLVQGRY